MGIEKSELKRALLGDLKSEAVERREALQADVHRIEGGISALDNTVKSIERDVFARLKRDIDEGKIDPETEAKQVDRYIHTCLHFAKHIGKQLTERLPVQRGRVVEADAMIKMLEASAEAESRKISAIETAIDEGESQETADGIEEVPQEGKGPSRRPAGVRPAPPLKARRTGQEDLDLRAAGTFEKSSGTPTPSTGPPTKKTTRRSKRGGKNT